MTRVINAAGNATVNGYDPAGRLTSVTDCKNQATQFEYDDADRRIATINPAGGRLTSVYDAAGRVGRRDR